MACKKGVKGVGMRALGLHTAVSTSTKIGVGKSLHCKESELTVADYPAIGYYLGKIVERKIPVIEGLPRDVSASDLKNLGAASASMGAVAMFHVIEVTSEARSLENAFKGKKPIDRISDANLLLRRIGEAERTEMEITHIIRCPPTLSYPPSK